MKYPESTAVGDAGEFFFAYKIARVLGWPCRLFDIDIGLDAQVEILDRERNSTGKFVAFQIKTTTAPNPYTYVRSKQLAYLQALDIPVFVVLVDLTRKTMWLHQIEKRFYEESPSGSVRIQFDLKRDRFGRSSAERINNAADQGALMAIREHLTSVQAEIDTIRETLKEVETNPDARRIIEVMRRRSDIKLMLVRAETLSHNFGVGREECAEMANQLAEELNELRHFMAQWSMDDDWDDKHNGDGDIARFLAEAA